MGRAAEGPAGGLRLSAISTHWEFGRNPYLGSPRVGSDSSHALYSPIYRRPRHFEQLAEVADRVFAGGVHLQQFALLEVGELRRLASEFALVPGDLHALAGSQPDEVALEFGEGGEDVEEHPAHGIIGVIDLFAQGEAHAALLQLIGDRARIRDRSREAIELRHDKRLAGADRGQCLGEAGAIAVAAGEAMVSVDAILGHAELDERPALGGEVLLVGRAAGISDERVGHL